MAYIVMGYFGTPPQVQAITEDLKATAAATREQLYPSLQPLKFKKESTMYVPSGALPRTRPALPSNIVAAVEAAQDSVIQVPVIGQVKKTHLYIGAAAIGAFFILKKMGKI